MAKEYETGRAAASWVFDGNTDEATYRRVLTGVEDGDPEVMDAVWPSGLSEESADAFWDEVVRMARYQLGES